MSATLLGTLDQYTPGAATEISDDNGVTLVRNRTMPASEAYDLNAHPAIGSAITHMNSTLVLKKIILRTVEGGMAEVSYEYGRSQPNDNAYHSPGVIGPITNRPTQESYSVDVTMESVSILRWAKIKYPNMPEADMRVLAAMIQFGPLDSNGNEIRRFLSADAGAYRVANKIEAGMTSVLMPMYIYKVRRTGVPWIVPDEPGTIAWPPGPAPFIGVANWLFMGFTAQGFEDRATEMELTFQSSISGDFWDSDVYAP